MRKQKNEKKGRVSRPKSKGMSENEWWVVGLGWACGNPKKKMILHHLIKKKKKNDWDVTFFPSYKNFVLEILRTLILK